MRKQMFDLYCTMWIVTSVFFIGYILTKINNVTLINQNLSIDFIGKLVMFYFLNFFVWHINLYIFLNDKETFDKEIRTQIKNNL